jgi:4-hydroxy-tetrahydrodipicolinate reductase
VKIGLIGATGRMGQLCQSALKEHPFFSLGLSFSRSEKKGFTSHLLDVFLENDLVIDFSSAQLTLSVLQAAKKASSALILCSTGWQTPEALLLLEKLCQKNVVVAAPNTSLGAHLQLQLVGQLAQNLDARYDIALFERHHRFKKDAPSGTAKALISQIQDKKKDAFHQDYQAYFAGEQKRPDHAISVGVERVAGFVGDHQVRFVSDQEMILVQHVAFDRMVFAKGALHIAEWIFRVKPKAGHYGMQDVLG